MADVLYDMQMAKLEEQGSSSQQIEGAEKMMRMMLSPAVMSIFQTISGFLMTTVVALVVAIFFKNRPALQYGSQLPPPL